jgi:nucleoid-associated protein YgaU
MGLFSFLKNAGAKLLNKKAKDNDATQLENLKKAIFDHGLKIEDLVLELEDDKVVVRGVVENQAEKEKIILALGNVEGIATVVEDIEVTSPEPEAVFYEVKSGDSLSKIAKQHYGNAMKYPVIFEANKPMLKDPNLIYPGQVLRIPPLEQE